MKNLSAFVAFNILILLFTSLQASAQSCSEDRKKAIAQCQSFIDNAGNQLALGLGSVAARTVGNTKGEATGVGAVTGKGTLDFQKALDVCNQDLSYCQKKCEPIIDKPSNSAAVMAAAQKDLQKCQNDIGANLSKGLQQAEELSNNSADSNKLAKTVGDSASDSSQSNPGYYDDGASSASSDLNPEGQSGVTKVDMTNIDAARKASQLYGPGTYGSGGAEAVFTRPDGSKLYIPAGSGSAFKPFNGSL